MGKRCRRPRLAVLAVIGALAILGCDDEAEEPSDGGRITTDAGHAADGGLDAATRDASVAIDASDGAVTLTDAQSAHVMSTIDAGEITLANIALTSAYRTDVREYAQRSITEHRAAQTVIDRWASSTSTRLTDNPVSRTVGNEVILVRTELLGLFGSPFDTAYLEAEVTLHQRALRLIDTQLVPDAEDPVYRSVLASLRAGIEEHLAAAQALLAQLGGSAG